MKKIIHKSIILVMACLIALYLFPFYVSSASVKSADFSGGDGSEENPYKITSKEQLCNVSKYLDAHFILLNDIIFEPRDFKEGGVFYNEGFGWEPIGSDKNAPFKGVFDGNGFSIQGLVVNIDDAWDMYAGLFGYNSGTITNLNVIDSNISILSLSSQNYESCAGGVVGYNRGLISNCYNSGTVSGGRYSGGIAGYNGDGIVKDCYNTGKVSGNNWSGGIVGYNQRNFSNGVVENCYNTGLIVSEGSFAGGIAGQTDGGKISNCYNMGEVSSGNNSGGIVGYNSGVISNCLINNCYNMGAVSSGNNSGGIVGYNSGVINNCYNTGAVAGILFSGGIAGNNTNPNPYGTVYNRGIITNCYNIGVVSGGKFQGGIAGQNSEGSVSNCYYMNIIDNGLGSGLGDNIRSCTKEEMTRQETFASFDFELVWEFSDAIDYPFPTLKAIKHVEQSENIMEFAGGNGTVYNPFKISTKKHLNNVRKYLDAHYVLLNDIVFELEDFEEGGAFYNNGSGWRPIGKDDSSAFVGYIEGNGFSIQGLVVNLNDASTMYAGLFGYNKGTIKNLSVVDANISATSLSQYAYAGGISGYNEGTISNCYNAGSIGAILAYAGQSAYSGGISGYNYRGIINDCDNVFTISCDSFSGGITGYNYYGMISNCKNSGTVSGGSVSGGIVGEDEGGTVIDCYNAGNVSAPTSSSLPTTYAGGITGCSDGNIYNCYNVGGVSGHNSGGIAGYNYHVIIKVYGGTIINCYNTGTVIGESYSGGVAGLNMNGLIENSYNTGTITGKFYSGGIAGYTSGTVNSCYNIGAVSVTGTLYDYFGGIAGYNDKGSISSCYYLNNVSSGLGYGLGDATSCTSDEMKNRETFVGFDFESIWEIDNFHDYHYPQLSNNRYERIKRISLESPPYACEIVEGLPLDLTGAQVKIYYEDGFTTTVNVTENMIYYDSHLIGKQNIYIHYGNQISDNFFQLTVLEKSIDKIATKVPPSKLSYVQGQPLNLDGGMIEIYYNNGTSEDIPMTQEMIKDYPSTTGIVTVLVEYKGVETSFEISVAEKQIKTWEILDEPHKLVYLEGEELDLTGARYKVTYVSEDDYSEIFPITSDMISGYDSKPGEKTIFVTFNDITKTFTVMVKEKILTSIAVTTLPEKIEYYEGDSFDPTGMVVTAYYDNGSSQVVIPEKVTGFDSTPGNKLITVHYQGKTDTFSVIVKEKLKDGWIFKNNKWYYYDNGKVKTGWLKDKEKWYYFDDEGVMQTGWQKIGGKWYYFESSGAMKTGWVLSGGKWYYLSPSGVMLTGWQEIDGKWYYLDSSGAMQTGWQKIGGNWYYLDKSGAMLTGWQKVGGKWYYLSSSGAMQTGWLKIDGKWYYLESSGAMRTGWLSSGGKWYYLSSSGAMLTGWQKIAGKWYYFYSDGAMAANTTIGGYRLGMDGAWIQ